ncbi:hypothetical protein JKP88DRAFT_142589, partial [Tribonema minus]
QVDVYESETTRDAFYSTRAAFARAGKPLGETWVFHGTHARNKLPIMAGGFKVGGVDAGIPVVNGAAYGHGVYMATTPLTPMAY